MDYDSKLIFEKYKTNAVYLTEEEESGSNLADFASFVGHVLDPTGISSYDEVGEAAAAFEEKGDVLSLGILLLSVYSALPNFGLLAFGYGGIGWAAAKAAARAAIKEAATNPQGVITLTNKVLSSLSKMPGARSGIERMLTKLVESGKITQSTADDILDVTMKGSISDVKQAEHIIHGQAGSVGTSSLNALQAGAEGLSKADKAQLATRAGDKLVSGETGVSVFPDKKTEAEKKGKSAAEQLVNWR